MCFEIKKNIHNVTGIALLLIALLLAIPHNGRAFAADKIPEPESWKFPDVVEYARKITPRNVEGKLFNTFGLVYSNDELKNLSLETMSPEELQKYADVVTHAYPDAVYRQNIFSKASPHWVPSK